MFEPYMAEVHRRATQQNIGLNCYVGNMVPWTQRNEGQKERSNRFPAAFVRL